jgi:hypothetical protein
LANLVRSCRSPLPSSANQYLGMVYDPSEALTSSHLPCACPFCLELAGHRGCDQSATSATLLSLSSISPRECALEPSHPSSCLFARSRGTARPAQLAPLFSFGCRHLPLHVMQEYAAPVPNRLHAHITLAPCSQSTVHRHPSMLSHSLEPSLHFTPLLTSPEPARQRCSIPLSHRTSPGRSPIRFWPR